MPIPSAKTRDLVDFYVTTEAERRGVTADSLTTTDLQTLAFALRLKDQDDTDDLEVANTLDALSELGEPELQYLERVSGRPATVS